jgi:aldehyde dehydrogenase (NAD+)
MKSRDARRAALLDRLGIREVNPGACAGPDEWIEPPGGRELVSRDPTTGQPLARVAQATAEVVRRVVERAADSFRRWRVVPAPRRGLLVRDLGAALREVKEPLGELVSLEMGKIRAEGIGEVQEMIDICDFAVGLSRRLGGPTLPSERPGHRLYEQWHPLGPIGIITSFNFPVAVWSWNAAVAAVCGDTMVWKPSSLAPLCAIAVQHISNRVAADHGAAGLFCLLVGGGGEVGERLIQDPRLPLVSFTGSVRMGRRVAEAVARRLGRTILELGGNNAAIVAADADLGLAVRAVLFAAVGTAGQRCTTTRRLIAHRSVAAELARRLVDAYRRVPIGDPLEEGTLMGPLVSEEAVDGMMRALERARAEGGEVLTGGERLPDRGACFVTPAIVRMPGQTPLVCDETFAPILYLMEYDTMEQALELQNGVPQGLSSAVFTGSLKQAERFLSVEGSDCGIANVNAGTSGAEIGGAFGGEKETGGGRESGSDAWKAYMRRQTVTVNWSDELPLAQGIAFG